MGAVLFARSGEIRGAFFWCVWFSNGVSGCFPFNDEHLVGSRLSSDYIDEFVNRG